METLYQYMSFEKCFSILRNKALPLRNFMSYNDPFECIPEFSSYAEILSVYSAKTEKQREEIINTQIDIMGSKYKFTPEFISGLKKALISTSILKYRSLSPSIAYAIGASVLSLSQKGLNDEKEIAIKIELFFHKFIPFLMNLYTSCFSEKKDNILMWSHYAQSHKGVVIEFNTSCKPFSKGLLKSVAYDSNRFDFSLKNYSGNLNMKKLVYSLLTTKGVDWQYEMEHRLIYDVKKNNKEMVWRDIFNNPYVKLDYDCINCIYIGRRASEHDINILKEILIEKNLDTIITLHNAKLARKGYKIEFY